MTTPRQRHIDVLKLGGVIVPGSSMLRVREGDGLDHKKPKGGKKASTFDNGDPLVEIDVTTTMVFEEDFDAWKRVRAILKPRTKAGARSPLAIENSIAALADVTTVTCGTIELNTPDAGQFFVARYKLTEWAPAPVKVKKARKKPKDEADNTAWNRFGPDVDVITGASPALNDGPVDNI